MIDSSTIEQLSRKYRIDNFTIIREYLQLLFLKYFYQSKEASQVYFKGGTAIHFIYQSFRFSEVLGFTSTLDETTTKQPIETAFRDSSQEASEVELDEQESPTGLKQDLNQFLPKNYRDFYQKLSGLVEQQL